METADPVIELHGLSKHFGEIRAIDEISLSVARGEVFGLLGPNGAGKSTTIACLLGQLRPTAGSGTIFGHDCWSERVAAHRSIGVLPSDFAFEDTLTGRETIELFARLRGDALGDRHESLAERLRANLDRPTGKLSRGNRQKIGLIAALAHEPDLIIMDEPSSGLDPLMQEEFLTIVEELRADGRTVLMSSHNLAEIERSCDRVGMIRDGRLFEVEHISALAERAPKRVRAVFAGDSLDSAHAQLAAFTGVSELVPAVGGGTAIEFRLTGSIDELIKLLAEQQLTDLTIARPDLDQVFIDLYEGDRAE